MGIERGSTMCESQDSQIPGYCSLDDSQIPSCCSRDDPPIPSYCSLDDHLPRGSKRPAIAAELDEGGANGGDGSGDGSKSAKRDDDVGGEGSESAKRDGEVTESQASTFDAFTCDFQERVNFSDDGTEAQNPCPKCRELRERLEKQRIALRKIYIAVLQAPGFRL